VSSSSHNSQFISLIFMQRMLSRYGTIASMKSTERIHSLDELVAYYHRVNWERNLYVGIEWERSGIYRDTFAPVQYEGDNGYNAVLHKLVEEAGWGIVEEDEGNIYELQRGETRITLEGDGRLELAGSPQEDLHDLARELRLHNSEVVEMGNVFGIGWLSLGMQPFHANEEIPMLKKRRYRILQDIGYPAFMATMTKRLDGITANLSYVNEDNAVRKAQVAFRILPIVGAMFACSPFDRAKRSLHMDERRFCIQNHAPQRTGIPRNILDSSFSFLDWMEYYAELPVVLVPNGKGYERPKNSFTFEEWMRNGYGGLFPTLADFDQHVKTTWSDIRLRPSYLEYRVADSVPFRFIMAIPALMKGLLFDSESWEQVTALTEHWSYEDVLSADQQAWKTGLQTEVHGKKLLTYAQELITIANEKLHGFERFNAKEEDESIYLAPLKEQIFIREKSPAEEIVSLFEGEWNGDLNRILEWCEME
jgi:glutamate--cysteine ligase